MCVASAGVCARAIARCSDTRTSACRPACRSSAPRRPWKWKYRSSEDIDRAHHDRDAARIVAPFAADALIFDLAPPLARPMQQDEVSAWLSTWNGPVERRSRDLAVTVEGDLAFATGFLHTRATTVEGGHDAAWWCRATICLRRIDSRWTIVHQHTSVPFYMDGTFRAATDLEPPL
jgi:ketosteroid isomerase-like protein